jgi:hypothetical protein
MDLLGHFGLHFLFKQFPPEIFPSRSDGDFLGDGKVNNFFGP